MENEDKQKITLEVDEVQYETIRALFNHSDWEFSPIIDTEENGGNVQNPKMIDKDTQTDGNFEDFDDSEDNNYRIEQDITIEECMYCLCRPCITDEQNRQFWWENDTQVPHRRNSFLRKEKYKRFWTMMHHRGVWNDERYQIMKNDAMERDRRRKKFEWHKRDIMPKCVLEIVRLWFPNPVGIPYMGHMWE